MFIDSHCHLDRLKLDSYNGNLSEAIQAAHDNAVDLMLCVAIDLEHIDQVLNIAKTYEHVYASVGVHPGSIDCEEPTVDRLVDLAKNDKVIAIGETGLDYYYGAEHKELQL
jgi:TatD DNase family protein